MLPINAINSNKIIKFNSSRQLPTGGLSSLVSHVAYLYLIIYLAYSLHHLHINPH